MIHYDDYSLKQLEREIVNCYDGIHGDYTNHENLLWVRRDLLNNQALAHQKELLSAIIAFNESLKAALQKMYNDAHNLYAQISAIQPDIVLTAQCYMSQEYASLHPYQDPSQQELWEALCDSGWNPLYESGVTFPLVLPRDLEMPFDTFIGMDCQPDNWNEKLDAELTKDLHLINAFHNLFDHTHFALTDFIYVRDFVEEINIHSKRELKNN